MLECQSQDNLTFNRHILESNRKLTTTNILSKKTPIAENLSGNDIKYLRKKYNLTQKELADALGLQKFGDRTIRRWEAEETHPSKLEQSSIQSFFNSLKNPPFIISENLPFKMIDLFAGIGGTRLGFQLTNEVETVFTSEWDKFAQKHTLLILEILQKVTSHRLMKILYQIMIYSLLVFLVRLSPKQVNV